jgi:DNA-binding NarL/FixJ family response regulator
MQPGAHFPETPRSNAARDDVSGVRIAVLPPDFPQPQQPDFPPDSTERDLAPESGKDPLLAAGLAAERNARPISDLASVWQSILDRRMTLCAEGCTSSRRYMVTRVIQDAALGSSPLSRIETAVLVRVMWGEQQKLVAAELGIACSTASKWYTTALGKTGLAGAPIPLPLIIAAQAWASGKEAPVLARSATFEHEGVGYFVLSVPRPVVSPAGPLTPAECEVARYLVEGETRWDIATRRETSAQTRSGGSRGATRSSAAPSNWGGFSRPRLYRRDFASRWGPEGPGLAEERRRGSFRRMACVLR